MFDKNETDKLRILVIDDNPSIHEDFRKILVSDINVQNDALTKLDDKIFSDDSDTRDAKLATENVSQESTRFDVEFAIQGQEGLELVKKSVEINKPFSLMFVDIRMPPGWDGIETIQKIWKVDPWIQTVICTAYSDYSWVDMVKFLGTKDNLIILKKPFDVIEVRQLAAALTKKWQLNNEVKMHVENLEEAIQERTADLDKSLILLRATLDSTADGILVVNTEGEITDYNKKFLEMWNIPSEILRLENMKEFTSLIVPDLRDPDSFLSKMEYLDKNIDIESLDEINFKNDKHFLRYSKPYKVQDKIIGRVWSFRDVTEINKLHETLLYQATHDKLTRLPNRRLLVDRIKQNLAISKRHNCIAAVLLFDIDRFKIINDSLGHTAGDFALRLIAARVTGVLREIDTLARLGGDEFVVTASDIENEAQLEIIANKILDVVKKPLKINNYEFFLTASIGISVYPKDGITVNDLLQKADSAMYRVKKHGKNSFKFSDKNESLRTFQLLSLENDLRKAIEDNELVLHYQPLVEMSSGNIVGVEALIRWNHPTLGLLMPDAFLPIAEESGLILPIGEWILREACSQNKRWQAEKISPLKMAINVSSSQIKLPKFDELIANILKETQLDPKYLELELTETVLIDNNEFNNELMLQLLNKIKILGVGLVIDDFGTGYSSLRYINRFPFNKLKIDKVFVQDLGTNEDNNNLVQSIIAMSANLKLEVVAEGVETKEQFAYLEDKKCDQAQGCLLSEPIDAQSFSNFLRCHPKFK